MPDRKTRELTESLELLLEAQQAAEQCSELDERGIREALSRQALLAAIQSYLRQLGGDYHRA